MVATPDVTWLVPAAWKAATAPASVMPSSRICPSVACARDRGVVRFHHAEHVGDGRCGRRHDLRRRRPDPAEVLDDTTLFCTVPHRRLTRQRRQWGSRRAARPHRRPNHRSFGRRGHPRRCRRRRIRDRRDAIIQRLLDDAHLGTDIDRRSLGHKDLDHCPGHRSGISESTLSVANSKSGSPTRTCPPRWESHRKRVP